MWSASGEVDPHENVGETKRRPIQRIGRRPGCPPVQDLVDSSGAAKMARIRHTRKPPRDMGFGVAFGGWLDQNQLLLRPPGGDLRTRKPSQTPDRKSTRLNSSH